MPLDLDRVTLAEALASAGGIAVRDKEFALIQIYRDGQLYTIPYLDYLSV